MYIAISTFNDVTTRRRPRGTLVKPRRVLFTLEEQADRHLLELAEQLGTSKSALAQWLIDNIEVDGRGVPRGWSAEYPSTQQELPINAA
jgi:hypothetical protein